MKKHFQVSAFNLKFNKRIVAVTPYHKPLNSCKIYALTVQEEVEVYYCTDATTFQFIEHFLNLQGTTIAASANLSRRIGKLSKNPPLYAPSTKQAIHRFPSVNQLDPTYLFTPMYTISFVEKKVSALQLHNDIQLRVKASTNQCRTRRDTAASLYYWYTN